MQIITSTESSLRGELLKDFDSQTSTWVVSDLRSKFDIQSKLLEKNQAIHAESVLRASELWSLILRRLNFYLKPVSRDFLKEVIKSELAKRETSWTESSGASESLFEYINLLFPIFLSEKGEEGMVDYFERNENASRRWKHWYELSFDIFNSLLERGFVSREWAAGLVSHYGVSKKLFNRRLIFDLGFEFSYLEMDLIEQMDQWCDVQVVVPLPPWRDQFSSIYQAYDFFLSKNQPEKLKETTVNHIDEAIAGKRIQTNKFASSLAEIKNIVSEVRSLADQSIDLDKIALASPNIENYWPLLRKLLKEEGIPVSKAKVTRLHSFPSISSWLSEMRIRSAEPLTSDLESNQYLDNKKALLKVDRFKVLYKNIYSKSHLFRSKEIGKAYYTKNLPNEKDLSGYDFLAWSLQYWPKEGELEHLELLLSKLQSHGQLDLLLDFESWFRLLELSCSQIEITQVSGQKKALQVLGLNSVASSELDWVFYFGLSESELSSRSSSAILSSEVDQLARDYGFYLPSPDESPAEIEIRWNLEHSSRNSFLSCSESDFNGDPLISSWLWIEMNERISHFMAESLPEEERIEFIKEKRKALSPKLTNWDSLCFQEPKDLLTLKNKEPLGSEELLKRMAEDRELTEKKLFSGQYSGRVSASSIEDYSECPFIFAAKRIFRLSDLPSLDIDVDALTKGSFSHKLLELLLKRDGWQSLNDQDLESLIEETRIEARIDLADESLWPYFKKKNFELARRFIDFEKSWRADYPETESIGFETDIKGYIHCLTGELLKEASPDALEFSGQIDRIDRDEQGHLLIIDYKSSSAKLNAFASWLKKNQFQLGLYSLALNSGLSAEINGRVCAAVYFDLKKMNRDLGFHNTEIDTGLYRIDPKSRKKNKASNLDLENFFEELKKAVSTYLQGIKENEFWPKPLDSKECKKCEWRLQCRAPHLN